MGPGDTQELLAAALAGGGGPALNELLEHVRPRLVMWAAAHMGPRLKGRHEPEDVAQVILTSVYEGWGRFEARSPASFWGWVRRIADNDLRDIVDYEGAVKRRLPAPVSFTQTAASTAAARREEVGRMMAALEGLEDVHREVIVLRDIEQRSVAEVAELLARSPNAVRVLHCRALKSLRARLAPSGAASGAETTP